MYDIVSEVKRGEEITFAEWAFMVKKIVFYLCVKDMLDICVLM